MDIWKVCTLVHICSCVRKGLEINFVILKRLYSLMVSIHSHTPAQTFLYSLISQAIYSFIPSAGVMSSHEIPLIKKRVILLHNSARNSSSPCCIISVEKLAV